MTLSPTRKFGLFTRSNQQVSSEVTNSMVTDLALKCLIPRLEQLAPDVSLDLSSLLRSCDYKGLVLYELDLEYLSHLGAEALFISAQILALFKKRRDLEIGVDKEQAAFQKFMEAESLCRETNELFIRRSKGELAFPTDVERVFARARRKILRILGPKGPPALDVLKIRFGKGATTRTPKRKASARRKLSENLCCGEGFLSGISDYLGELPGWIFSLYGEESSDTAQVRVIVDDAKLDFVPKNAKTYRPVTPSPSLDVMFQLGVGDYLASRLKRFGVDLNDQSLNRDLARVGSLTGDLATLDLSSASDTVSIELVYDLLPVDWANFLWSFRTPTIRYKGKTLKLQKFSSMGNGFTFPLETLIFFALAKAVADEVSGTVSLKDRRVSVYGDDIIIPVECFRLMSEVLRYAGFLLNEEKSFHSGHFRESCGGDYLSGIDVRPCFIKDALTTMDIFTLHNFMVRRGMHRVASFVRLWLDPRVELWGPEGYGDGHLLGDWQPLPAGRAKGWGGYWFHSYRRRPVRDITPGIGDRVLPSYQVYSNPALPGLGAEGFGSYYARIGSEHGRAAAFHNVTVSSLSYEKEVLGVVIPQEGRYQKTKIYTFSAH